MGYALTALADMVDGYLARRLNSVTPLGALLDPVTDIVNRLCALLALSALGIAPWRLMAVYILLVLQYAVDARRMGPAGAASGRIAARQIYRRRLRRRHRGLSPATHLYTDGIGALPDTAARP